MNTIKKLQLIILALAIAIGLSSCSNNDEVVKKIIHEYNKEAVGLEIDNFSTVLEAELDGKDIIFPFLIHSANFNNISQDEINDVYNSDMMAIMVANLLDQFSEKEANAIINGKYNIILQYVDDNDNYIEFPIENSDIKDYFE